MTLEPVKVHLIDGTYELFRYFFALPRHLTATAGRVAATRGVVGSVLTLLEEGATTSVSPPTASSESVSKRALADLQDGRGR